MSRRNKGLSAAAALLLVTLVSGDLAARSDGGSGSHWGYGGAEGPGQWGSLGYPLCAEGMNQSPIDIAKGAASELDKIQIDYRPAPLKVVNNGHTVKYDHAPGSFITVGGKRYQLLQFHFHAGSEHTLGGRQWPMELHLVHQAEDKSLAVIGIFVEPKEVQESGHGGGEGAWDLLLGALPGVSNLTLTSTTAIDPQGLFPHVREYYHYMGSLTTPPCSEGVSWFVMKEPVQVSARQIERFRTIFDGNFRPIQPLNSRSLLAKDGEGQAAGGDGH